MTVGAANVRICGWAGARHGGTLIVALALSIASAGFLALVGIATRVTSKSIGRILSVCTLPWQSWSPQYSLARNACICDACVGFFWHVAIGAAKLRGTTEWLGAGRTHACAGAGTGAVILADLPLAAASLAGRAGFDVARIRVNAFAAVAIVEDAARELVITFEGRSDVGWARSIEIRSQAQYEGVLALVDFSAQDALLRVDRSRIGGASGDGSPRGGDHV